MRNVTKCYRLLERATATSLAHTRVSSIYIPTIRSLATISPRRPQTTFTDNLNSGPSLSDFLTSSEPTSIPGTSHLPEWLKRPIPAGGNFAKIKKDLRGLNLHTGNVSSANVKLMRSL